MAFQPLTKEQYDKAISAGFTPESIIANEQKRKADSSASSAPAASSETATAPSGLLSKVTGAYSKYVADPLRNFASGAANQVIKTGANLIDTAAGAGAALEGRKAPSKIATPEFNTAIDTANPVKGFSGKAGELAAATAELAAPTGAVSKAKAITGAISEAAGASGFGKGVAAIPAVGKKLSYIATKVMNALPETAVGTIFGKSQGESNADALKTGVGFGVLSGAGELAGDALKKFTGDLAENVSKAIGFRGKMSTSQATEKIPQATRALKVISDLAPDITVKDAYGIEKPFNPRTATFWETMQAQSDAKNKLYKTYTELAKNAGDDGASFKAEDFHTTIDKLKSYTKDSTSAFKNKVGSLIKDLEDNFGTKNPRTGDVYFKNTDLERMQNFVQNLNVDVNPMSDKAASQVSLKLSDAIRDIMDKKITESTGKGYQALRNSYGDMKSIENDLVNQFKKVSKGSGIPGYIEDFGNMETIVSALTLDAHGLVKGIGKSTLGKILGHLKDPEVNLQNAFKMLNPKPQSNAAIRATGIAKPPTTK